MVKNNDHQELDKDNANPIPTENMNSADFRKYGYEMVDRIAAYFDEIEDFPVLSQIKPGSLRDQLPKTAPIVGEGFESISADIDKLILPAITHWNHPNFHGLFSTSTSKPGILAEMLAAAFDQKAMLWRTSPASTELEEVVLEWLRQMISLPTEFQGMIYDTASISTLQAIAVARESLGLRIREEGMSGRSDIPLLRLYCSRDTHNSIEKGLIALGLGQKSLVKIDTDEYHRIDPNALKVAIAKDIEAGYLPFCVVATIGTTSTSSVDNIEEVAAVCDAYNLWLHVDAAYAGNALILKENQHYLNGIENADSFVVNPHKWFFTPFDLSVLYLKDIDLLKQTFSLDAEYLKVSEEVANQMDYGIQLGRRFRSLKLWFVMRYFGQKGIQTKIREHIRLAHLFASWAEDSNDFEVMAPVPFALVCFRATPRNIKDLDGFNMRLMDEINSSGKAYLSHTKIDGKIALRLSVGSFLIEERHLRDTWHSINSFVNTLS